MFVEEAHESVAGEPTRGARYRRVCRETISLVGRQAKEIARKSLRSGDGRWEGGGRGGPRPDATLYTAVLRTPAINSVDRGLNVAGWRIFANAANSRRSSTEQMLPGRIGQSGQFKGSIDPGREAEGNGERPSLRVDIDKPQRNIRGHSSPPEQASELPQLVFDAGLPHRKVPTATVCDKASSSR
jgi:hypothetical protein